MIEEVESEEGESDEDEDEEEEEVKPKVSIPKPPGSEVCTSNDSQLMMQSSEYETDSEEESEEEKKPAFRPVFVKKDARGMTAEKAAALAEEKIRQEEELRDQRKNDSKEIAGETIRRELAESECIDFV
jgi:microfibrillar-associated protein 1